MFKKSFIFDLKVEPKEDIDIFLKEKGKLLIEKLKAGLLSGVVASAPYKNASLVADYGCVNEKLASFTFIDNNHFWVRIEVSASRRKSRAILARFRHNPSKIIENFDCNIIAVRIGGIEKNN